MKECIRTRGKEKITLKHWTPFHSCSNVVLKILSNLYTIMRKKTKFEIFSMARYGCMGASHPPALPSLAYFFIISSLMKKNGLCKAKGLNSRNRYEMKTGPL